MNFEPLMHLLAELVNAALPDTSPWRGKVYPTVADPKEDGTNTFAVVHVSGGVRELVAGNYTMAADCRLYGQLVPTEGGWSAAEVRAFADELSRALVVAADELLTPAPDTAATWVVLGVHLTGAATMEAERGIGYAVELPFQLSVQF